MKLLTEIESGERKISERTPSFGSLRQYIQLLLAVALAGAFVQSVRSADGDLDPAFGSGGKVITDINGVDRLNKIALQADGKIIAVGAYRLTNGVSHIALARYNSDGTLDTSFGANGKVLTTVSTFGDAVYAVAIQTDGKIIAAGTVLLPAGGDTAFLILRYNANGTLDQTFGTGGVVTTNIGNVDDSAEAIALQTDGKIVVSGEKGILRPPGEERNSDAVLVRYNANGSLDTGFGTGGITISDFGPAPDYYADDAADLVILPDGKTVIVGTSDGAGYYDSLVARYNANGTLDTTFGTGGRTKTDLGNGFQDDSSGVAVQADGKIVAVGAALPNSFDLDFALIRYNADGTLDTTFGAGGKVVFGLEHLHDEELNEVAIQADGKIVAVGDSNSSNNSGFLVLRFNADGTRDAGFGTNGIVRTTFGSNAAFTTSLVIQTDAKIVAAGYTPLFQSSDFALVRYLNTPTTATRAAAFDFDGDQKTDVSIFCNGLWNVQPSNGGAFDRQFGLNADVVVPADYDGDGKTDVAVFRQSDGDWHWLNSRDGSYSSAHFGASGDVPVVADYDGDRRADLAVYRGGVWYIQRSTDGLLVTQFGLAADKPVPADYDGDGKADIAVYRPSNGEWWLNESSGGVKVFRFGTETDKAVPADYTGDGRADIAVWRPSSGEWFVLRSENQSYFAVPFGQTGDIPLTGDYDGDGRADFAIYRAGQWWIWQSRTNNYSVQQFGNQDDMPVPSAFVR
jgi:uncharacterized delta-60 repeat protein